MTDPQGYETPSLYNVGSRSGPDPALVPHQRAILNPELTAYFVDPQAASLRRPNAMLFGGHESRTCKIATWNINSVRLRMPIVAKYLQEHHPDVLCLQEQMPRCGISSFVHFGSWATIISNSRPEGLSRRKRSFGDRMPGKARRDFCKKGDARHLTATDDAAAVRLNSTIFYVPAGGDEAGPRYQIEVRAQAGFFDEAGWELENLSNATPFSSATST